MAVLCLLCFGRGVAARWTRFQAFRCLEKHSASAALDWLHWSSWISPDDGRTELLRAKAYRHLQLDELVYFEALDSARSKGADRAQIEREARLQAIESGAVGERADRELSDFIAAGESPHDVCRAFVFGYLQRQDSENAKRVLDAWAADFPSEPHVAYVRGVFWRSVGNTTEAESELRAALKGQERHELAAVALARLYEQQQRPEIALEQWIDAAKRFPASDAAHVGLAQMLRTSGRAAEAREVLAPRVAQPLATRELLLEASDVEFQFGNYEGAFGHLREVQLEQESQFHELLARSAGFAVDGEDHPGQFAAPSAPSGGYGLSLPRRSAARGVALQPGRRQL